MSEPRFERAIQAFRQVSAADPVRERVGDDARPRELVHLERLVTWVERLAPDASEPLRLAAHCQHIGRFRVPRESFPEGRGGYLRWRAALARQHAATAADILREVGYDHETIASVERIVQKQTPATDPEVQTMEDALCLAFLEHEFPAFSAKHPDDKLVTILRKTWRKMSERGHEHALALPLDARAQRLVAAALTGPSKEPR